MRFLLDMGASVATRAFLAQLGHDSLHLRDEHLQRMPDDLIVAKAVAEDRIIITFDLDFSRILALSGQSRPSVILFRLERQTTPKVKQLLEEVIRQHAEPLEAGAIILVEEDRIRVRLLPVR